VIEPSAAEDHALTLDQVTAERLLDRHIDPADA
jgi:hypothetical protein